MDSAAEDTSVENWIYGSKFLKKFGKLTKKLDGRSEMRKKLKRL